MGAPQDLDIAKALKKESLRYITDAIAGFFRQKFGKSFKYYDLDGKLITDIVTKNRIESLVIPPAWKEVWICAKANGHMQATGIDEKNRKQYIYHPDWTKISQENKFSKIIDFGLWLPKIRRKIRGDMKERRLDKEKIIATIIWLLENTFIRIGNAEYASENDSFGLTTLRNRHVTVKGEDIILKFKGKSGVDNTLIISNPTIVKTIKRCIELPGYELFQFIDDDGNRHVIDSQDVNTFLQEITNDDFTAKDFRTWGGTNLSANILYKLGDYTDKITLKKNITDTVKRVAQHLNNTVSVCRSYYIHPSVIKTYQKKVLVPYFASRADKRPNIPGLSWDENALIKLLQKYPIS